MSLKEKLAANANELVDDKAEGWLDKGLDEGEKLVDDYIKGFTLLSEEDKKKTREKAKETIDVLRNGSDSLARLGTLGFAKFTAYLVEDNEEDEARRYYLAHDATFAERRRRMQAITDGLISVEDAEQAAWEAARDVVKQAASLALPFLLKLVAKMAGIPL